MQNKAELKEMTETFEKARTDQEAMLSKRDEALRSIVTLSLEVMQHI